MKKTNYINQVQRRTIDIEDLDFRAEEEDGKRFLSGYAIKYGTRSVKMHDWDGPFYEVIDRSAGEILKENPKVVLRAHHSNEWLLASTINETLRLESDDIGLKFRGELIDTREAETVYKQVQRGDIYQNSFAFVPSEFRREEAEDGTDVRVITKFSDLRDVSPVVFPAYEDTTLVARDKEENSDSIISKELFERLLGDNENVMFSNDDFMVSITRKEKEEPKEDVEEERTDDTEDEKEEKIKSRKSIYNRKYRYLKLITE